MSRQKKRSVWKQVLALEHPPHFSDQADLFTNLPCVRYITIFYKTLPSG